MTTITSLMLENEARELAPPPSEREILRQTRGVARVAAAILVAMAGLLAIRFAMVSLRVDDTRQPFRFLTEVTYPMVAPLLDWWPSQGALEVQSLVAAVGYLMVAFLLHRWARRRRR